jgi:hypothetical protein|tara:strand:- start:491 stop:742 length:252 start_codon:yes stop_codon:yes gene_type:complete
MPGRVSPSRANQANRNKGKGTAKRAKATTRKKPDKPGYNARKDEQLGMTRGKESSKKMSMKGRRDVAKATRKPSGSYGFKKKA